MVIPEFIDRLEAKYQSALKNRNLFFIPTELSHQTSTSSIRFDIIYAPSLSKKPDRPTIEKPNQDDPFSPPYVPDLFVCEFDDSSHEDNEPDSHDGRYVILLNKFCVIPRHFLLVTKAFMPQTSPPSPADLYTIRIILEQAHSIEPQNEWIAFFNCGPESGASQPHKHFQFIPIKKGCSPFGDLIARSSPSRDDDIFNLSGLSFSHFIILLPHLTSSDLGTISGDEPAMMELGRRFMKLLDSMIDRLRHLPDSSGQCPNSAQALSYNLVMTRTYMFLVPRSKENFEERDHPKLSINSLGVGAGMILVKDQDHLDLIRRIGVDNVLADVTFPALKDLVDPCSHGWWKHRLVFIHFV